MAKEKFLLFKQKEEPTAIISVEENCGGLLRAKQVIDHRGLSGETSNLVEGLQNRRF